MEKVGRDTGENEKESGVAKEKAGDSEETASTAASQATGQQNAEDQQQPRPTLLSKKNKDRKQRGTATGAGSK